MNLSGALGGLTYTEAAHSRTYTVPKSETKHLRVVRHACRQLHTCGLMQ